MKKFRDYNTYFKLLILIISTSVLFFLLYVALYVYTTKQENNLYKTTQKQYYNEVSSIIKLYSKTPISTIIDITFWNELKKFTESKDENWYKANVASQFETYEVDYLGVHDIEGQFIVKTSNSKIKTKNFIPKEVMTRLYQSKLMRFYMKIPEGVIEVFGATIHPSNDPKKNKTKPSGYFFMARLLDQSYFKNLGEISSSEVKLVALNSKSNVEVDALEAIVKLKGYNQTDLANLVFKRSFNLHFRNTKEILVVLILASFINIFIYLYFSRKWIYKPLKTITNVLETGNETSIAVLKNQPGEFGYIGNLFEENNYQRKQLELSKEKAEESDKLKSSFLANLSHEIRTPMNAIVGFSDLLNEPNLSDKSKQEYLKIIKNCGINLVSIIEDLIEMSKIDSKQISPNYKGIDLDACVKELYETIRVTIPNDKELDLYFVENKTCISNNILTDEVKLKQIIVNLISNAIKYTVKGKVTFGYQINEEDKNIEFIVKDTGLGIDEGNLKVIFDRFRRIEDEFSVALSGLGLGLAISKAYIEMLGGTISVHSKIKVGSEFKFTIPLIYDESIPIPIPNQINVLNVAVKQNYQTILVAEDDNINFLLIKRILELKKYKVLRAINGQEAVDICRENVDIHLVLMDIKMPVLNGFEAFKIINSFNPKLPVIAQTAYASVEDYEKIMELGFTAYVSKPLDKEKIFELIDSIFYRKV
ncbi:ATP-binding protein [Flavobacterium franklandianum]|uniref:histidine kinase n=1 Tax=Flavobacterium franklandianum TaxID=2594430 RepID=A0A553C6C2_9FLAO|nr:ATP-binding protein [Flavobacterium franklandianum]TRX16087.1 response regulator [Flavobacterium franklandianum]